MLIRPLTQWACTESLVGPTISLSCFFVNQFIMRCLFNFNIIIAGSICWKRIFDLMTLLMEIDA